ncbi:MAG: hypothetical protein R2830_20795 [Saprospiraceae bacterium]
MKNLLLPLFLLFAAGALFTEGCYYDNEAELHPEKYLEQSCDTTITMSYANQIKPILDSYCSTGNPSCHNSNSSSNVPLNTYEGVKSQVDNGRLLSSITWDGNASFMPKNSSTKINDCYQARIRIWIESGAPNN